MRVVILTWYISELTELIDEIMKYSIDKRNNIKYTLANDIFYIIGLIISIIWLIAAFKVFIIDENRSYNELIDTVNDATKELTILSKSNDYKNIPTIKQLKIQINSDKNNINDANNNQLIDYIPKANEWRLLQSSIHYNINDKPRKITTTSSTITNNKIIKEYEYKGEIIDPSKLKWPPVLSDGSIPDNEGFDKMPLTELKVPKFWKAPQGADINKIGEFINNQETIYLMIASYRDFQCRETIASAFNKADHPERLFVGAVDQVVAGDIGCLDNEVPCSSNPDQPLCKYRNQIAVFKMDARYATGPVTARHVGDRMYRGHYFVMQMDAHCLFVRHWDTKLIDQWKSTGNEMAVLTSYMTDIQGSLDGNGDSLRDTRPIMCCSDFEGTMPARYLRHGAQPEEVPVIKEMPMLEPFWAAGFSFSRAHFKLRVPYDGYQPMVFQGEEIAIGIRGFTHGYDFYAPRESVAFHEYAEGSSRRKKIHMFWENSRGHQGEGQKSLRRATGIIGMAPDVDPKTWDHTEEERYGLGTVRPLELFYKVFLIDPVERRAFPLCPFVRSGKMHKSFQKYLRPDRLGIDYSKLTDFDTKSVISEIPAHVFD